MLTSTSNRRGTGDLFAERIEVPFPWETVDSGIEAHWLERASYRRSFSAPQDWANARTVLHFGAVHHEATVWVDGRMVGVHVGGYTPFEFDITDYLSTGREANAKTADRVHILQVDVSAPNDKRQIAPR